MTLLAPEAPALRVGDLVHYGQGRTIWVVAFVTPDVVKITKLRGEVPVNRYVSPAEQHLLTFLPPLPTEKD